MTDLNDLVAVGYDDVLTTANDIDDFGRITGQGFDDDAGRFVAAGSTKACVARASRTFDGLEMKMTPNRTSARVTCEFFDRRTRHRLS